MFLKVGLVISYFGVAIGTFFSHGLAIIFGSSIGSLENENLLFALKIITYTTFLLFGIIGFLPKKEKQETENKTGLLKKIGNSSLNYVFIIAMCIIVGEIGDKTFLASMGLGLQYPNYKIALIAGAILGMVLSNSIAILFGRFLNSKLSSNFIGLISNCIFIAFGIIGFITILF